MMSLQLEKLEEDQVVTDERNISKAKPSESSNKNIDLRNLSKEKIRTFKTVLGKGNPFRIFLIDDNSFLNELDDRVQCSICGKSRKYFCYTCYVPVKVIEDKIPNIELPCPIDIIKHPREIDGKSTAIHAAIVAPRSVKIYTYPDIPNYETYEEKVFVIFPDKDSITLEECFQKLTSNSFNSLKEENASTKRPLCRAVFIDSTWNQTKRLQLDERLRGLTTVELTSRETLFWRYQKGKPKTYLATIEAIYYFVVDFHKKVNRLDYAQQYDNLLFFFKFMYEKIHSIYDPETLLAYKEL